jgi:hypothetical protein
MFERLMRTTNSNTASTIPMNTAGTTLTAIDSSETNRQTPRSSAIAPRCGVPGPSSRRVNWPVQGSICWIAITMTAADSTAR